MLKNFRDRLLQIRIQRDEKHTTIGFLITGIIVILLLINIVYLNIILFSNQAVPNITIHQSRVPSISPSPIVLPTVLPTPCLDCLSPSPSPTIYVTTPQSTVKDYFIPLGSGTNQTSDWADVPGVQAVVDFGQYTNIKEIHFEASVYVPTANESVSVRLFNVSDKHSVWYSEVTMPGGMSAYLTSPSIAYDKGTKLYQVQMKTQLKAQANLVQARIHLTLR